MKKELLYFIALFLVLIISGCQAPSPAETAQQAPAVQETPQAPEQPVQESVQNAETIETIPEEPAPAEPETPIETAPKEEYTLIQPTLTYSGAYNGPLYDTSLQIGSTGDMDKHFANFDRNGMNFFVGYFKIDYPPEKGYLASNNGLGYMLDAVQKHPYRAVPYMSLSTPGEEVPDILGEEMTSIYRGNYDAVNQIVPGLIKGFGELEIMAYSGYRVNSPELVQIYDLAKENGIWVMFHPKSGQAAQVKEILEEYPGIMFLIHMYREDLSMDADKYIDLMKTYDNLFFSIDAAHIINYNNDDILYSYADKYGKNAAAQFISTVNSNYNSILNNAVSAYKKMVTQVPDKVMWGTEAGPDYAFEPEVYDLMIKMSREFISKVTSDVAVQEDLGYKNALRVFGKGVKLDTMVDVMDASGWSECTNSQISKCEDESDKCAEPETPESEACLVKCTTSAKCYESYESVHKND